MWLQQDFLRLIFGVQISGWREHFGWNDGIEELY